MTNINILNRNFDLFPVFGRRYKGNQRRYNLKNYKRNHTM